MPALVRLCSAEFQVALREYSRAARISEFWCFETVAYRAARTGSRCATGSSHYAHIVTLRESKLPSCLGSVFALLRRGVSHVRAARLRRPLASALSGHSPTLLLSYYFSL